MERVGPGIGDRSGAYGDEATGLDLGQPDPDDGARGHDAVIEKSQLGDGWIVPPRAHARPTISAAQQYRPGPAWRSSGSDSRAHHWNGSAMGLIVAGPGE